MKITGLDNKEYSWSPSHKSIKTDKRSKLHEKAKNLLTNLYPNDMIIEEIVLPGSGHPPLRADIFLPMRRIMVEVHGEQHFEYNKFFFKDKGQFFKARARDRKKIEWCNINDIMLVEFNFNESEDEWKMKLRQ